MTIRVAEDVWVDVAGYGDGAEVPPGPPYAQPLAHPTDLAAAAGLPPWRVREFLAGRALLRRLLREVLPAAGAAEVVRSAGGRPVLAGWPTTGISVSHDADTVAVAVAISRPVGVDVQHPPSELTGQLVRRCLRDRAGQLDALPPADRAVEFAWVWTVQEACVKADGTGLRGRPWTVEVPVRPRVGRWRAHRWIALRDQVDTPLSCAFRER